MTHQQTICRECETVAHCTNHGCIPKQPAQDQCRTDGRCQYAIDSGAEGMGHCPKGKCVMPAQQQEPVACKPVAWLGFHMHSGRPEFAYNMPAPSVLRDFNMRPLVYGDTSPPPPPQRKPLTDEQIDAAVKAWFENEIVAGRQPFAKRMRAAIEAAHGIKGDA